MFDIFARKFRPPSRKRNPAKRKNAPGEEHYATEPGPVLYALGHVVVIGLIGGVAYVLYQDHKIKGSLVASGKTNEHYWAIFQDSDLCVGQVRWIVYVKGSKITIQQPLYPGQPYAPIGKRSTTERLADGCSADAETAQVDIDAAIALLTSLEDQS